MKLNNEILRKHGFVLNKNEEFMVKQLTPQIRLYWNIIKELMDAVFGDELDLQEHVIETTIQTEDELVDFLNFRERFLK